MKERIKRDRQNFDHKKHSTSCCSDLDLVTEESLKSFVTKKESKKDIPKYIDWEEINYEERAKMLENLTSMTTESNKISNNRPSIGTESTPKASLALQDE